MHPMICVGGVAVLMRDDDEDAIFTPASNAAIEHTIRGTIISR
jgi:hypothetical protein